MAEPRKPDTVCGQAPSRTATGTVVAIEQNVARIQIDLSDECGACSHKRECRETPAGPTVHWPVNREAANLAVGQRVSVRKSATARPVLAGLVYALPLATLLLGAFVGDQYGGDVAAVVGCAAGLLAGGLAAILIGRLGNLRGWWRFAVEPLAHDVPDFPTATGLVAIDIPRDTSSAR